MKVVRNHPRLILLLGIVYAVHTLVALIPPLNGDEATFWEWSRHLAFGYYAHPPLTAWLVALVTNVFGDFSYTVRLPAILLHLGTIAFVYAIAMDYFENKSPALLSAMLYAVLPLSMVLGTAMTTDAALIFFFTAALFFLQRALFNNKPSYWYAAAVACGGMMLTKFMSVLFFPPIVLFLLINRDYRKWFLAKEPYLAALVALLIFSPFLYWNYQNNWLTFQFNFFMRHQQEGFDISKPFIFLAGQLLAASPVIFFCLIAALLTNFISYYRKPSRIHQSRKKREWILFMSYFAAFPLIYFGGTSTGVKVAPHWPAIVYPVGVLLVTAWIQSRIPAKKQTAIHSSRTFQWSFATAGLLSIGLCLLVIFPKVLPDHLIYTKKVYDKAPPVSHYFGWKEIGHHVDQIKQEWENRPEGLFFTSKDYSLASMLGFYTPSHPNYYLMNVGKDIIHGKSYLLWEKGKKKLGANTIYVSDEPDSWKSRLPDFFKEIRHWDPFVVRDRDGRILRVFYIAIGLHYLGGEPDNLSLW